MQNNAQKQEILREKLKELEQMQAEADQRQDLFEENEQDRQDLEQPQEKLYDIDQVMILMWNETITGILQDCPMSEYQQIRLMAMKNRLLHEMDLDEFIPRIVEPEQVSEKPAASDEQGVVQSDIVDVTEPQYRDTHGDKDLEIISQKLKDIDKKGGLLDPEVPEPEPTGLKKLLGGFGSGKKKVVERTVSDEHQPTSMG
jgi:hypothetical protein